jgi:hypothetical protein
MRTQKFYTQLAQKFAPKGAVTKTAAAWHEKAEQRAANRPIEPLPRKHGRILAMAREKQRQFWISEISRRGFETKIETEKSQLYGGNPIELDIVSEQDGLCLLACEGLRYYSRRVGSRYASLAYLCGTDDNGPWAVRVPGTCASITTALEYVVPAEVKRAKAKGLRVIRQGDVFAIEIEAKRDGNFILPRGHKFDHQTRVLSHTGGHKSIVINFPVTFVTGHGMPSRSRNLSRSQWD